MTRFHSTKQPPVMQLPPVTPAVQDANKQNSTESRYPSADREAPSPSDSSFEEHQLNPKLKSAQRNRPTAPCVRLARPGGESTRGGSGRRPASFAGARMPAPAARSPSQCSAPPRPSIQTPAHKASDSRQGVQAPQGLRRAGGGASPRRALRRPPPGPCTAGWRVG